MIHKVITLDILNNTKEVIGVIIDSNSNDTLNYLNTSKGRYILETDGFFHLHIDNSESFFVISKDIIDYLREL